MTATQNQPNLYYMPYKIAPYRNLWICGLAFIVCSFKSTKRLFFVKLFNV